MGTKRVLRYVTEGPYEGWLCFKHPDGQWVTLRKATDDDLETLRPILEYKHRRMPSDLCVTLLLLTGFLVGILVGWQILP
jgi:hypothetical protein